MVEGEEHEGGETRGAEEGEAEEHEGGKGSHD